MPSRILAATGLAVSILIGMATSEPALAQNSDKYLRSEVIYNEQAQPSTLRLKRKTTPAANQIQQTKQQPAAGTYLTPTFDQMPPPKQTPVVQKPAEKPDQSQLIIQQSLASTIASCFTLIATGVNARQLSVPEELELRNELNQIIAVNKAYADKGYTSAEFQEIQQKLVTMQLHIYAYGTNAINR